MTGSLNTIETRKKGAAQMGNFAARPSPIFKMLYALENHVRVRWSCNHSCELPWYNEEVPTVGVSLNYTNHLIDVPQLHTFVNAYGPTRTHIRAAIEKICGRSGFKGAAGETVFCDRWDTRL